MNNITMSKVVREAVMTKFYGNTTLKSKAVPLFPDNIVREYMRVTNTYMTMLNKELAAQLPVIRKAIDAEREGVRMDNNNAIEAITSQSFMQIQSEFEKRSETFGLQQKLESLANMNRKLTIKEWKRVVHRTLGIDILDDYYMGEFFGEMMKQWTSSNVELIKTIPKDTLYEMKTIVIEGYMSGRSNTSIAKDIQSTYGINRRHAHFIARDQVAKLNADMTQAQHKDAGVEEYIWSTSGDERVRRRHSELDGKTFSWADPPIVDTRTGRRGHPGEDYQCRCVALPVFNLPALDLPWANRNKR